MKRTVLVETNPKENGWDATAADWGDPEAAFGDDWSSPAGWGDLIEKSLTPALSVAAAKTDLHSWVVQDFATDEEVHLELHQNANSDDALKALRETRTFPKNVSLKLVLLPSGEELLGNFCLSQVPPGETLKFMATVQR